MIEDPRFFYSSNMVNARYFLYAHGFSPRLLAIELWSTLLFICYYFGLRVVGVGYILYAIFKRTLSRLEIALICTLTLSLFLTLGFIQKGEWYNPIQFGAYGAFILSIFSAKFFYYVWESKNILARAIIILLIVITLPATLIQFNYLNHPARSVITKGEINAFNFLKKQPTGVVFLPIFDRDGTYVSAFGGQQTYINGMGMVRNSGLPWEKRLNQVENMSTIKVDALPVQYVYVPSTFKDKTTLLQKLSDSRRYKKIFENSDAVIFLKID